MRRFLITFLAAFAMTSPAVAATVEQYDSIDVGTVPAFATHVAGYTNGHWPTYFQMLGHFQTVVSITVTSRASAECDDIEPGNSDPSTAGGWARNELNLHHWKPCLYTMLSEMPQVKASLAAWHVSRDQVRLWDANWTFRAHVDPGYDCTQWTDRAFGLNLDESTCLTSFYKPVVAVDPFHYDRFLGPFPSQWGPLNERDVVLHYDGARKHPIKYAAYLAYTLQHQLYFLAYRDASVAFRDTPPSWGKYYRGWRFQQLIHRAQGQKLA